MPWYHAVAERDHELQNPTSAEKIRLLGERLRLDHRTHVLDLASGKGGPAAILAGTFGCRITCVERSDEFHASARTRIRERGLASLVEVVNADAKEFSLEPRFYDVAMCLGASFIWGGLDAALAALDPAARAGGHVVVGEPYWKSVPDGDPEGFVSLGDTVDRFERAGLPVVTLIASSDDDWDRYETLHWRAVEDWLAANRGDPDADAIRTTYRDAKTHYLVGQRERLGWAMFVGRKG